jgi:hypothetical protein
VPRLQRTFKNYRVVQPFSMGIGNTVKPGDLLEMAAEDQRTRRLLGIGRVVESEADAEDDLQAGVRDILRAPWAGVTPALRGLADGDEALLLNAMQEAERQEMADKNRHRLLIALRNEIARLGGTSAEDAEVARELDGVDPDEDPEGDEE